MSSIHRDPSLRRDQASPPSPIHYHSTAPSTVTMPGFRIRSAANFNDEPGLQVFVSKYTNENGSVAWYNVAPNFNDVALSSWNRNAGFETVVFRNQWGKNRAFYLQVVEGQVAEVTFFGMERDISINYVKA
ncbi:hypothetical protein D9619_001104 [Psilocybe cf. subviscida]|uniref:Uncharacterized protein n=1 Tax=Psilocybe cf. subviscida TaxID=2480587 RepID=A0A8H5BDL4_9AGAR|nr:hypothetical protein D9619_001104 [Psilocybe cf. subviscida]